jgi:hypothetical protein
VDVGGPDQRQAELTGGLDDSLVGLVLLRDAVLLELELEVVGAEDVDQLVGVIERLGIAILDQALAKARLHTA